MDRVKTDIGVKLKGLVLKGTNNVFSISCEDGVVRSCSIKGKILKESKGFYNPLAVGDFVIIEVDNHNNNEGLILELLERKNKFLRLNQKTNSPQLLVANIDLLICVSSCDNPPFRPRFIDRILVQAEIQHIPALIFLNKSDLKTSTTVKKRCADWERLGYTVLLTSAKEKTGLDKIIKKIANKTIAVIGQSGVGKSSLLNSICPNLNLKTSEISEKYNRGTHTTTQGEFFKTHATTTDGKTYPVNIIDTPGVRSFLIYGIEKEDLAIYFKEMEPLIVQCKFGLSCTHTHEKKCAVLEALKTGKIFPDRYTSWQLIFEELKQRENY